MIIFKNNILILLTAIMIGCSSAPTKPKIETERVINMPVPKGKALIYVVRSNEFHGSARQYMTVVNNKPIGLIDTNQFYVLEVPPAKYYISPKVTEHIADKALGLVNLYSGVIKVSAPKDGDDRGVLIDVSEGNKYYTSMRHIYLEMHVTHAKDASILREGIFSSPELIDVVKITM